MERGAAFAMLGDGRRRRVPEVPEILAMERNEAEAVFKRFGGAKGSA
jgi:hypothetical protein